MGYKKIFRGFLHFLQTFFPHYCQTCQTESVNRCQICLPKANIALHNNIEDISQLLSFCEYDEEMKKKIHAMKYHLAYGNAHDFARILARSASIMPDMVLVPVPIHPFRLLWRGYNQSWQLCKAIQKQNPQIKIKKILKRTKNAPQQAKLSRNERIQNAKGLYEIKKGLERIPKRVILVDDVCATGSTLKECAKVLKKAGAAEVSGLVIARPMS